MFTFFIIIPTAGRNIELISGDISHSVRCVFLFLIYLRVGVNKVESEVFTGDKFPYLTLSRCNILTCSVVHSHLCTIKQEVEFICAVGVMRYMLIDVLHNPGTYTNGYSVYVCPLCVLEYRAHKNITPACRFNRLRYSNQPQFY